MPAQISTKEYTAQIYVNQTTHIQRAKNRMQVRIKKKKCTRQNSARTHILMFRSRGLRNDLFSDSPIYNLQKPPKNIIFVQTIRVTIIKLKIFKQNLCMISEYSSLTGVSPGHLVFCQVLIIKFVIRRLEVSRWERVLYVLNVFV